MFNSSLIKKTLLFLILAELLSLFGWFLPQFNMVAFFVILFITLILSLRKLEYGLYILLAELFVASEGYLFSFEFGETFISIRIGLFLVVMGVFLVNVILRRRNDDEESRDSSNSILNRIRENFHGILPPRRLGGSFRMTLLILALVILWGFVWGIVRGNDFGNVFLDFNNWLYFLLILPIFSVAKNENFIKNVFSIFTICIFWVGIKSLILLYIFSHQFVWALPEVYKWVRDTRVGEVTLAGGGFYRVFLQSQIYSLLTFFVLLPFLDKIQDARYKIQKNYKLQITKYLLLIICLTTIILSFSRSYWVGFVAALLLYYFIILLRKAKLLEIIRSFGKVLIIAVISFGIVLLVVNLPPRVIDGDLASLLGKRMTEMGGASASRINQLEPLGLAITKHPVIGSGFGTTLTYITNDPRVVPETAGGSGEFTTYAFEWGYLDMVLKFGLFGTVVYLILIFSILKKLFKIQDTRNKIQKISNFQLPITNYQLHFGFGLALIALLAVNVFSPYLNHPLGIGFIILTSVIAHRKTQTKAQKNTENNLK